jgi:hypothetical protein
MCMRRCWICRGRRVWNRGVGDRQCYEHEQRDQIHPDHLGHEQDQGNAENQQDENDIGRHRIGQNSSPLGTGGMRGKERSGQ